MLLRYLLRTSPHIAKRSFCQLIQHRHHATSSTTFNEWRNLSRQNIMANSRTIHLTPADTGVFHFKSQDQETANRTSELLQDNHENHHVFFNQEGFHNHIAHHILTLYALGASTEVIEKHYRNNASYQRPALPVKESIVENMRDAFGKYLGKEQYYHDFLIFFQNEIEAKGLGDVLQEYLFNGSPMADDMLVRMFAGFLHPIIHLGFGLEFNQPAIVAEALAQAAVHLPRGLNDYFHGAEKAAASVSTTKSLPELIDEISHDKDMKAATHWDDGNKLRDGVFTRAPERAIHYASQWKVKEETLESQTAEMINTAVYFTTAAQHPPKVFKIDFFYMHCVNSSIFWTTFNKLPFLTTANKIRLLEWKGRVDLVLYASRGCPELLLDEVTQYVPMSKEPGSKEWQGIFQRFFDQKDDGHAVKLARALAHAGQVTTGYEDQEWARIKPSMCLNIENAVIDSVEDRGSETKTWVRSCGFDQAWEQIPDRPKSVHL